MKEKLLKIFDTYSKRKAGYIPLADRDGLADEIVELIEPRCGGCKHTIQWCNCTDWAGLDPVKWKDVKPSRKYIIFGDTEDITITP